MKRRLAALGRMLKTFRGFEDGLSSRPRNTLPPILRRGLEPVGDAPSRLCRGFVGVLVARPILVLLVATPLQAERQEQKRAGPIRVETNLVNILASVIDENGEPVADLAQDAFQLSEEGVPQRIDRFEAETNRPLDLALMVESSMTTYKDKKVEAEAAAHFVRQG